MSRTGMLWVANGWKSDEPRFGPAATTGLAFPPVQHAAKAGGSHVAVMLFND